MFYLHLSITSFNIDQITSFLRHFEALIFLYISYSNGVTIEALLLKLLKRIEDAVARPS